MSYDSLLSLLNEFHCARVLVVGDVMLDRFIYGSVERISPEAPVPVFRVERTTDMPGGAANVLRNCAALGANVTLIGVVGDDEFAAELERQLNSAGRVRAHLVRDRERPTTVKTRYVADKQQVMRADRESRAPLAASIEQAVLSAFRDSLPECEVLVLSDYAKGVLTDALTRTLIDEGRRAGKQVLVDPKSTSFAKYAGATVLTPNRGELQAACGFECSSDEKIVDGARVSLEASVCDAMIVTRGPDGMTIAPKSEAATHLKTMAREVFDVSGAGDTVLATLALGLAAGGSLVDAATLANVAAGLVVSKHGTAVVTPGELMIELELIEGGHTGKVLSLPAALYKVRQWRERGLSIAFTNGCFDLLHPGHISLLTQARNAADKLIVGLNADESVQRLKGPERPVQSESARATVLESLASVDGVVIFRDDTPLKLIKAIAPDVLVKGADYTVETVVGAPEVLARGGRVMLADLVKGHSTTETLRRVGRRDS